MTPRSPLICKLLGDSFVKLSAAWAYLVMVVACVAATTIVAAADSSAGCRQSTGSFHRAARLLKG